MLMRPLKVLLSVYLIFFSILNHADLPSPAVAIYNQAYQENYDADKLSDILDEASDAYVLLDPFMSGISQKIPTIKSGGNQVACYMSVGTGENWRDDFQQLKTSLVNQQWDEWQGEFYLKKITKEALLVMQMRIQKMADWGCDWIEFDNMDWASDEEVSEHYGILVGESEAQKYVRDLCRFAHVRGLRCMAKNGVEGFEDFDGVTYESYADNLHDWDQGDAEDFLAQGKLMIIVHYNEKNCDAIYDDYADEYEEKIGFICEDVDALNAYRHYIP